MRCTLSLKIDTNVVATRVVKEWKESDNTYTREQNGCQVAQELGEIVWAEPEGFIITPQRNQGREGGARGDKQLTAMLY